METKIIYLDSGVLIEYFRKKDKSKSKLFLLSQKYQIVKVSSITYYEILLGSNKNQIQFWNEFFEKVEVLSFDQKAGLIASKIYKQLKRENKLIAIADILIAAVALANELDIATLNRKHFERIDGLSLIDVGMLKS
ncbi:MAG: type II toxin-antitoxin system VapC family toxin [Bacteroidota bacterium]